MGKMGDMGVFKGLGDSSINKVKEGRFLASSSVSMCECIGGCLDTI